MRGEHADVERLRDREDFVDFIVAESRMNLAEVKSSVNVFRHQLQVVAVDVVVNAHIPAPQLVRDRWKHDMEGGTSEASSVGCDTTN
ncbi:MAG: hypothetical protein M3Y69_02565 [Verrucomicrobiota bacterium]|nr:hypothetical protein [Verrucomicrobiota bacterium]